MADDFVYGVDDDDGEQQQPQVPVVEPAYPSFDEECVHDNCQNDALSGERLCSNCDTIMLDGGTCGYCGISIDD